MRIVFLGTPEFAIAPLGKLIDCGHEILAVVTQDDKPKGRGNRVESPPVKQFALTRGIKVLQYKKIRAEGVGDLNALKPDIMVTAAYGQILSEEILAIAKHGVINVHASLLPKYRGAAPVQWAIMCGETVTGVTIMQTAAGVDTGDMILSKSVEIGAQETAGELMKRLSQTGADALAEAVELIGAGRAVFTPQDDTEASHFPMLRKTDGEIDWSLDATKIACKVRALDPWPAAYTYFDDVPLKIWKAEACANEYGGDYGEVVESSKARGIIVKCGKGSLRILELQLPNSKRMSIHDFLNGKSVPTGIILTGQL